MPANRNQTNPTTGFQVRAIEPREARDLLRQGYITLDARSPGQYGQGHVKGAINVYFRGHHFAERAAAVTSPDARLILVVEEASDAPRAAEDLARVGRPSVVGYLTGGLREWQEAGLPFSRIEQSTVQELAARRKREKGRLQVLDVREEDEWVTGHIPGAIHIPFHQLDRRASEIDPERPVAVYCSSGQRSSLATSLLERHGFRHLANDESGFSAWRRAGYEFVREEQPISGATLVEDLGYALKVRIDLPFKEALARVQEAIRAEGMEVIVETDLERLLKQKAGVDVGQYHILGTCDLGLASDAIKAAPDVGVFMPCNVLVYQEDGRSVVTAVNPDAIVEMVRHPALADCASGIRTKLEMVLQRVRGAVAAARPKAA